MFRNHQHSTPASPQATTPRDRLILFCLVAITACGAAIHPGTRLRGLATYYNNNLQGHPTASGTPYDKNQFTAAHKTLPFGTKVKVTNQQNMKSVVVEINDRGPFGKRNRIIDLSYAAARQIGMIKAGVIEVWVDVLSFPTKPAAADK